jgi:hypothetical protein
MTSKEDMDADHRTYYPCSGASTSRGGQSRRQRTGG